MKNDQVARVRQLLQDAASVSSRARIDADKAHVRIVAAMEGLEIQLMPSAAGMSLRTAPPPIRRKHLIQQIRLRAKHYGLGEEVDGFIFATSSSTLSGMDNEQLDTLLAWQENLVERMEQGCDPPSCLPAR